MTAPLIVQLLIACGPAALEWIASLAKVWSRKSLSLEEVIEMTSSYKKSYDQYLEEARNRLPAQNAAVASMPAVPTVADAPAS